MVKAKKFQPLQMLNQKLRGLEVFESNNDAPPLTVGTPPQGSRGASPAPAPTQTPRPTDSVPDPDDIVNKLHWQRSSGYDQCCDPMCGKRLGGAVGSVNCRHCGKLFCDEHTLYQMRLSRSAQHEPVRGLWYRVCETCYKTREGYNDHNGAERNHFDYFKSVRRRIVDKQYLETSRLETRLTRLTQLLADPPPDPNASASNMFWSSVTGSKPHIKALEQTVVPWQEDADVNECPFCHQPFSQYSFRRHHCRTCGRVVCADPATACSSEIGLDVDTSKRVTTSQALHNTNIRQSLTRFQRSNLAKSRSTYDFAKTVSVPSSAKLTLRVSLPLRRRTSVLIRTWSNSSMAFASCCQSFNDYLLPCKIRKSRLHQHSWQMPAKSGNDSRMLSRSTMLQHGEYETCRQKVQHNSEYRRLFINKHTVSCMCTCYR